MNKEQVKALKHFLIMLTGLIVSGIVTVWFWVARTSPMLDPEGVSFVGKGAVVSSMLFTVFVAAAVVCLYRFPTR